MLSCPVCLEGFPAASAAFALHVASCSTASASPPSSPAAHCARCLHVYAASALPHEISFHEHECARVNELQDAQDEDAADGRKSKRQRNATRVEAAPSVSLFPSSCFLCGNGGRGLLHCRGSCARAAHHNCVDQLQAPATGTPLSVADKKQAADDWRCAQCLRGLHRCQSCGFLGHAANGMRKCSVLNCGYVYHEQCLPHAQDETVHAGFVCPRHTCVTCGGQETDMRRCKSCQVCHHMTHLRCPRGSGQTSTTDGGLDPTNLFVCPRHDGETTTSPTSSTDASNSLRIRLAAGDVVLILEFSNALLPSSAKAAAPDAANYWGIVISAEETEPRGHGNQLLSVRMFADDNVLTVPNQYAVRVASASDAARPVDLIRQCVQRHAMVELQLRQMAGGVDDAEAKRILRASTATFTARLEALGVTEAQARSDAELGLARWRQFLALPEPRCYDGLGDSAPIYLLVDTRGSRPGQQASAKTKTSQATAEVDGDVSMTDADTDSGGATATNGSTGAAASPNAGRSHPSGAGQSSHETGADQKSGDEPVDSVVFLDKHQNQSAPANQVEQSQVSTQDTVMASTQDTQPESWSPTTSTNSVDASTHTVFRPTSTIPSHINASSDALSGQTADVNSSNKRPAQGANEGAKRQKINTEIPASWNTAAFTPIAIRGLVPGATLSAASAPAALHISPMSGSVRTMFPQKRKQLTRKEKLLAGMPPLVLEELEREAFQYLQQADGSSSKPTSLPADADAFPWAARATKFRPAFYRPTVMLGHSGLRRPGVDAVSRLLVSQDKRSIKCFVQTTDAAAGKVSTQCDHISNNKGPSSVSPAFVYLDLMSLRSVYELESVVRTRLVRALGKRTQYTSQNFGMGAHQAQRWLEQQRRKKVSEQPPISLLYCGVDGVQRHLKVGQPSSTKPSPKEKQAWLVFCANVCHLSVVVAVPNLEHSTSTSVAAQSVAVAGTAK